MTVTKASPLSGLLDAAFGSKASDASKTLDALELRYLPSPANDSVVLKTIRPSDPQTVRPLDGQTVRESESLRVRRSDRQTLRPVKQETLRPLDPQTRVEFIPMEVRNLPYNPAAVLEHLIVISSRMTNYRELGELSGMSQASARDAVSRLVLKGFLSPPVTVRSGAFQGFSYVLNKDLCDYFICGGGLSGNYRQTLRPSDPQTVTPSDGLTLHSSSLEEESTTTSKPLTVSPSDHHTLRPSDTQTLRPSDQFILNGAIGIYWGDEGLTEQQAQKWCVQFEVDVAVMKQQLEWARYDLEVNSRRSEVKKDTISWFFGHLRVTGGSFPKPVNYRSPLELRAAAIREQQEADAAALKILKEADFENQFNAMMQAPESEAYKAVYAGLSDFCRAQLKSGSRLAAEFEMKQLFRDYLSDK